ncbi:MAG: phosphatidate cytidylyltransferase [Candidatus Accumulibacter sp.]|jgi:phosphatidate cytidylyltransferase|nr:phosphatidate cytidylyltransferase [Accumulibacter sp.]
MLEARIITAVFLLAGLLGALFFLPDAGWIVLCASICALAAWEWGGLAGWSGKAKVVYALVLGGACFVLASRFSDGWPFAASATGVVEGLDGLAVAFWLLLVPFWLKRGWPLRRWSAALVGGIVLLPPMLVFIGLRHFHPLAVLAAAAPVWVADIAAYFSGRAFGRARLAPTISPGKTWAGAIGAAIGVTAYCAAVFVAMRDDIPLSASIAVPAVLGLSIGLTALSIVGDLFESLLKRRAGVKDSSHLLPGHGGILDRIDSLTSTLPVWPVLLSLLAFFSR